MPYHLTRDANLSLPLVLFPYFFSLSLNLPVHIIVFMTFLSCALVSQNQAV